jgi:dihydrofolate reductase
VGKVVVSKSMSLDGFVAGPRVSVERPMGEGGHRLHEWFLSEATSAANAELQRSSAAAVGAVILGKRTFDIGVGIWGDTPFPVPTFVLANEALPVRVEKSGSFTFIPDGLERALEVAQHAAGAKDIVLMGADISRQFLKAGLVDEIHLTVVPVLLGGGTRLFDDIGQGQVELEYTMVSESGGVSHLTLRVLNRR